MKALITGGAGFMGINLIRYLLDKGYAVTVTDIVVAQVEENSVTLKRFFKERNRVRLQPANEAYEPQFYDDVRIQGKLVGVIRRVD